MNHSILYTHTTKSGLRIAYYPDQSAVTYLGLAVGVGTRYENYREYGLAHCLEHMLFKGTKLRSATHIIQRIEEIGGELNAYTSKEETMIYATFPQPYMRRTLHLLADIAQHSIFPEAELEKEKTVIIDEIQSYEDSPSELIFDEFENLVFRRHPLGHPILGTEASVRRMNSKIVGHFFGKYYRPDNMVLFAMGQLDFTELVEQAELLFPSVEISLPPTKSNTELSEEVWSKTKRKDTHQAHILLGTYAPDMYSSKRLATQVAINLLGGAAMNSRLNMLLRERHGLVYNVEANYTAYADTGLFTIYFGTSPKNMNKALDLVYSELQRMIDEPIGAKELEAIKRQLKGQLAVSWDSRENLFLSLGKSYLYHNRMDSLEERYDRIDRITIDDLIQVIEELFIPQNLCKLVYR